MKITAQEEYGLRILLRIARYGNSEGLAIPEISEAEGLSTHNVAKLCRILRMSKFIKSSRGKSGGYMLERPADKIDLMEVLNTLGGRLYSAEFCERHSGVEKLCSNSIDCSVRSLWKILQLSVDQALSNLTLGDLMNPAQIFSALANQMNEEEHTRSLKMN